MVALLLHRIKCELIAEKQHAAAAVPGAAAVAVLSSPRSVVTIVEEVLRSQAEPQTFLDALMGGLNLLRFLLADGATAERLRAEGARLRRETLQLLDARLRRAMDEVHRGDRARARGAAARGAHGAAHRLHADADGSGGAAARAGAVRCPSGGFPTGHSKLS